eukprot:10297520-Ditylum_brightwellii.AAC.2
MIVMTSANKSDRAAVEPREACKRFFNCKAGALTDQELNFMLKAMGLNQVGFANGLVQHFHTGPFNYPGSRTPCNLSVSTRHVFEKIDIQISVSY